MNVNCLQLSSYAQLLLTCMWLVDNESFLASFRNWGHWYGPEGDKYVAMKYENGQGCWNGPNRSCHVSVPPNV